MSTWVTVWFVIGLISATAVLVCGVGLVKHVVVLSRTLKGFQEAVAPVAADIAAGGARVKPPTSSGR